MKTIFYILVAVELCYQITAMFRSELVSNKIAYAMELILYSTISVIGLFNANDFAFLLTTVYFINTPVCWVIYTTNGASTSHKVVVAHVLLNLGCSVLLLVDLWLQHFDLSLWIIELLK